MKASREPLNVMLTSAGRRGFVVGAFRQAMTGGGRVLACDASAQAPALQEADEGFVVPPVTDPGYIESVLALCDTHRVGLLIPALEPELPLLAASAAVFAAVGTLVLMSSAAVIACCYDKLAAARFLRSLGLPAPWTGTSLDDARAALRSGEVKVPLVVKPRWGVSSIGVAIAEDEDELELTWRVAQKQLARSAVADAGADDPGRRMLIQQQLAGDEYGLDVINDLQGRHAATLVRRKLRMRAGQTDRAITVRDERLEALGALIGSNLRHVGVLDCDVFVAGDECYAIDLNPRIGGGYPFSHLAGANVPAALLAWARGMEAPPGCFAVTPGVCVSRSDCFTVIGGPQCGRDRGAPFQLTTRL